MTDNEIIKANDILDKLDFFGGQRAGRELWFNKPEEIQNEDIKSFVDDIAFLKDFINRQQAELEKKDVEIDILIRKKETLKDEVSELMAKRERLRISYTEIPVKMERIYRIGGENAFVEAIKSEARKEFWEQIKAMYGLDEHDIIVAVNIKEIDNLLAEMEGDGE